MPAKRKDSRPKKFSQRWDEDLITAVRSAAKRAGTSATNWVKAAVRRELARDAAYSGLGRDEKGLRPCEISPKSPVLGVEKKDSQTA